VVLPQDSVEVFLVPLFLLQDKTDGTVRLDLAFIKKERAEIGELRENEMLRR